MKPQFEWDFADGSPLAKAQSPTHTFKKPGVYKVQLRVVDATKRRGSDEIRIDVEPAEAE